MENRQISKKKNDKIGFKINKLEAKQTNKQKEEKRQKSMRNTYQCRDICSYTQEFHETTKLESMIHMQRTLHNGYDSLQGDLESTLHLEKLSPFFFSCS